MTKNNPRRPSAQVKGARQAPPVIVKRPNDRHGVTSFSATSWNRKRTSLIDPWVDVQADMDAINAGEGIYDPSTRRVWDKGRLYGMHEDGTAFPIEGDGIVMVNDEDRIIAMGIWRMREEARGDDADDRD